ncbi:MAG: hypothetical protein GY699_26360 [Desulfobacteraceae bacterium]|nr:hypothetical protein [Desulfobacteraceae bacterium]
MHNNNVLRPVIIFGYCLVLMSFIILLVHSSSERTSFKMEFRSFAISVSLFHFVIGLGVLLKKKWGYYCFRLYLYLISVGFPIGTFIGLKMLKYIDKHDVKKFFGEDA